jgi:hypothetical protein
MEVSYSISHLLKPSFMDTVQSRTNEKRAPHYGWHIGGTLSPPRDRISRQEDTFDGELRTLHANIFHSVAVQPKSENREIVHALQTAEMWFSSSCHHIPQSKKQRNAEGSPRCSVSTTILKLPSKTIRIVFILCRPLQKIQNSTGRQK